MKPVVAKIVSFFLVAAGLLASPRAVAGPDYLDRLDVRSFIEAMHDKHGIATAELERILGAVRYQPVVVRLTTPMPSSAPSPARSYANYRAKFLTPELIAAGAQFWARHAEYLRRAHEEFGVPPELILGILGVETRYGQNTGSFRVLDALATIAFDGARRQEFFRGEQDIG